MMTVAGVGAARGEYVNFESSMQPVLTFSIRAVPKTVAGAYADAFQTLQRISAGVPLSELAGSNPYLALAGRLLGNIADEANQSDRQTLTTAVVGLSGSAANSSPFPLDGTPTVIFLRRSDDPPPLPEPNTLKLCANNPGTLCSSGVNAAETTYAILPYLIVRASTTNFRPTADWAGVTWSCDLGKRADQAERIERALRATRFTDEQERAEFKMLERVRVLGRAYSLPDRFDLQQGDNIVAYASVLNAWRFVGPGNDAYWNAHYGAASTSIEACFQSEMKHRSPQHDTAFIVLDRAFAAARAFRAVPSFARPLGIQDRTKLEEWLTQITEPIRFLKLKGGETYGSLRAEQDSIERLLVEPDQSLAAELVGATDTHARDAARAKVSARLLSPCDSCRAVLTEAIAQANLLEANAAKQQSVLALQEAERARSELVDARQRAEQVARLADTLRSGKADEIAQLQERIAATEASVSAKTSYKAALDDVREDLNSATGRLRDKLLAAK